MSKISELSDGGSLVSTDFLIAVRSGGNVKVKMDTINVDQVDLGDNEFIRLGNSQDLTLVHNASNSIINQAGIGNLLIQKAGTTKASITANGLEFPDNSKAIFGAGSDLQIYHDPSAGSIIQEAGAGSLFVRASTNIQLEGVNGENMAIFNENGAVQLYYDNAEKLATTATGIDVTGTVMADALTVAGSTDSTVRVEATSGNDASLFLTEAGTGNVGAQLVYDGGDNKLYFKVGNNTDLTRMTIERDTGDISFYNDAAAQGLFWDSSASMLGLGTTIPGQKLEIKESSAGAGDAIIRLRGNGNNANNTPLGSLEWFNTDSSGPQPGVVAAVEAQSANANGHMGKLLFKTHDGSGSEADPPTTRMTIDESGNLLVGRTATTTAKLHLENATDVHMDMNSTGDNRGKLGSKVNDLYIGHSSSAANIIFKKNIGSDHHPADSGDETMRIDSSSKLLIGTTHNSLYNSSTQAHAGALIDGVNDNIQVARWEGTPLFVNRMSTDGNLVDFRKDGAAVGSIGVDSSDNMYITSSATNHVGLYLGGGGVLPMNSGSLDTGDNVDIGSPNYQFADGYLSGNLLVGGTSTNPTGQNVVGAAIDSSGEGNFSADGAEALRLNRKQDGDILKVMAAGNVVATIGVNNNDNVYIGATAAGHGGFYFGNTNVAPMAAGTRADDTVDLGATTYRWQDIYLSGDTFVGEPSTIGAGETGVTVRGLGQIRVGRSGTASATLASFNNGNGEVGTITTNGSATAYNTSSDHRLKENVVAMSGATERLKQLKPSRFNFIADADTTVDGFLAHEVADVVPEAITGAKDAMHDEEYEVTPAVLDDDGNVITEAVMGTRSVPDYQGIDQSKLVPLLVATIQELEARIAALES